MKKTLISVLILCMIAAGIAAGFANAPSNVAMTQAAQAFLAALAPDQKTRMTFQMTDAERQNFKFTPVLRKGLAYREMTGDQRALAQSLLSTALSQRGLAKVLNISSLEAILKAQEFNNPAFERDPNNYLYSIFGTPSETGTWGWRYEGHHTALYFTIVNGKVTATPTFFGTNPAEVKDGPRKGFRALKYEEEYARDFLASLDANQKKIAIVNAVAPRDIISGEKRKADPLDAKGLPASSLNAKQLDLLMALIGEYAGNLNEELAATRIAAVKKAGNANIHFAWQGTEVRGEGHYYSIQTPTFLIEYDNTQNNNNHIHSVWREFNGDFGLDLLAEHYKANPHVVLASR
jgi:hypothetical protein